MVYILMDGLAIRSLLSLIKVAVQTIFLVLCGTLRINQALRVPSVKLVLLKSSAIGLHNATIFVLVPNILIVGLGPFRIDSW